MLGKQGLLFKPEDSTLSEDQYIVTHHVNTGHDGARLDAFLKLRYRKRSRVQIQRAIDEGSVTIKREQSPHLVLGKLKASTPIFAGDEVQVLSERKPEPEVSFDYQILHEDTDLLIVSKPAPLPVHPAGRYFFNTLLVHLRTRGHQDPLKTEREYYLPHRIDKETSGVLVLAKERTICRGLVDQFASRQTEKTYQAIVHGRPDDTFEIDAPMRRSPTSPIEVQMEVAHLEEGAQSASTAFTRLETFENRHGIFSLIECRPKTGRQHQIRVHLAHAGYPIVGDKLYGMPVLEALQYYETRHLSPEAQARLILDRHALHAHRIGFKHPHTGVRLVFEAPLARDLADFVWG